MPYSKTMRPAQKSAGAKARGHQETMDWGEFFSDGKPLQLLVGVAGAAAMAATDWRGWRRLVQHMAVGVPAAMFATPILSPAISKVLGIFTQDSVDQQNGAVFITGAFAIYLFEFIREVFAAKRRQLVQGPPEKASEDKDGA